MIHARDYVDTVEGPQPDHHPNKKWIVRVMEGKTALSKVVYAEAAILRSDGTLAFGPLVLRQSKARLDVFIKTVPNPTHFFNMTNVTEWYEDVNLVPAPPPIQSPDFPPETFIRNPPTAPAPVPKTDADRLEERRAHDQIFTMATDLTFLGGIRAKDNYDLARALIENGWRRG